MADYDIEKVRADFPILTREVYGKPLVYLDNGASAQKPTAVIDAVSNVYSNEYSNVHRGLHFLSNATTDAFEVAREKVRSFLNAASADEIIFTRSSTEAINLVAHSYGGANIEEGDEIILSIMEHHSNIVPWFYLREQKGAVIKWAPVDEDGNFLMDEFKALFSERTKIVGITHMSNALGTVVPIKEVCAFAHSKGVPVMVDGSQGAVHMPVDVQDLDADFYCVTGHKLYGPSGIGVLYGKMDLLKEMPPYMGGGEMIKDVTIDGVTYNDPPHRFEAGTPPIAQAIGLGAALDYMDSIGRENIAAHEAELTAYTKERLGEMNSVRVIGEAEGKAAIFSFEVADIHAHDVSMVIDRAGVAVRAGTHCVQPLLQRFGVTSTCRASFGMYNTKQEVDVLAEALKKAQDFFG
ncbi:MAG: cysteine desulfurase [Hyphomicrobiales bacterium]